MKKYTLIIAILLGFVSASFAVDITFQVSYSEAAPNGIWLYIDNYNWYWDQMTDDDQDGVYTHTVTGVEPGTQFWYNYWKGDGDDDVETVPPESSFYDNNARFFIVPEEDVVIPVVGWSQNPETLQEKFDITFSCELGGDSVLTNGLWMVSKSPQWHWAELNHTEGDVYSKEWQLFGGQLLPFTFVYGGQDNWSGEESVPEDCNFGTPSAPERHYTAPFENESPQTIPFGECVGNNGLVSVTYRVDMNAVTMDEGDIVWAHVNPNDLWPEMSDEDNDGVYTVTLNHYPDIEVDYYFAYGTNEEYDEETVPAECSNDQGWREYTVTGEDHILPAFKYGSCDFTGLNNVSSITNYSIYPNPAINDITIDINQAYRYAEISLLDIHGRLISKWQIEQQEQFSVPLDQYSNGLYFIKMDIDNVIKTQKLIIGK